MRDARGGVEFALVEFGGGEGGDESVHSVLGREHPLDGWAVEGEEAGEEGEFEVGAGGRFGFCADAAAAAARVLGAVRSRRRWSSS